jgi:dTDP-4-dehydrorhamnose reductase
MKVAIIGSTGQLGSDLRDIFSDSHEVYPLSHNEIQVENIDSVNSVISSIKPDVILNTAAFHVVPMCEQKPDTSYSINALGSLNVARVSQDLGSVYVYYSTDYVFDGKKNKPYVENDCPCPLNVYGSTKLAGEYYALNYCDKGIVIRVSGIYGKVPCRAKGGNFITTMIKLAKEKNEVRVVADEVLTPTPTSEIARSTLSLLGKKDAFGLFHMTSEGECSWYEFASVIFDTLKLETPLVKASVKDLPMVVRRPIYSVLENRGLKTLGIRELPDWKESLINFLKRHYL